MATVDCCLIRGGYVRRSVLMDPLTRAALVGLRNGGELPEPASEAEALAPADSLLLRAGARVVERRAGRVVGKRSIPLPAPAETAPVATAAAVLREAFRVGLDAEA